MVTDDKASSKSGAHTSGPGLPYADAQKKIEDFLASAPPELRDWADARAKAVRDGSDSAVSLIVEDAAETPAGSQEPVSQPAPMGPVVSTPSTREKEAAAVSAPQAENGEAVEISESESRKSAQDPEPASARGDSASKSTPPARASAPKVSTPTMAKDATPTERAEASDANPCLALEELGESAEDMPCMSVSTPSSRPARPHPSGKKTLSKGARILIALVIVAALGFGIYKIGNPVTPEADNPHGDMAGGMSAQELQDSAKRIKELEAQVKENPDSVEGFLEMGLLKFNMGDMQGAEEAWLKVTELDPDEIQAWYNLGFCYLAQDPPDTDKVREMWQHVIDIDPSSPLAQTVQSHMGALQQQGQMGDKDSDQKDSGDQDSTAPSNEENEGTN